MKNFKKVIAFLMVAAMTLGMGLTAFADDAVDLFEASKVEAVESGSVTISLIAKSDVFFKAGDFKLELNSEFIDTDATAVKGLNELEDGLMLTFIPTGILGGSSYVEETGTVNFSGAGTSSRTCTAKAGEALVTVVVPVKKALSDGDVIGTFKFAGTLTTGAAEGEVEVLPQNVEVKVTGASSSSSDDVSTPNPTDPTTPGPNPTDATNATDANNATAANNAPAGTNAPAATAKDIVTKDDALNALDTLAKATAAAAKLTKTAFANDADYQAFTTALAEANKVLNNPKATDAEKAAALAALKTAMGKADEATLVAAVKTVVNTTPATTKAGNGKTKTGDTAPVAALMLVAIAAFGTAVVVYRKKVNA